MKRNKPFIKHILDEIDFIMSKREGLRYEDLVKDETLKRAFLRSLEVIGEATKNLSNDFKGKYPEVEWRELAGFRDILIHKYFAVRWDIIWSVIEKKIPPLKEKIESILTGMDE